MPLRVFISICFELIPAPGVTTALTLPVPIGSGLGVVGIIVAPRATKVVLDVRLSSGVNEVPNKFPNHQQTPFPKSRAIIRLSCLSVRLLAFIVARLGQTLVWMVWSGEVRLTKDPEWLM